MSFEEFNIRTYKPGDEKQIVPLLKESFPDWESRTSPLDYWKWKYIDTPLKSSICVALKGDEIVSVGHFMNLDIKLNKDIYRSQFGDDHATSNNYRKKGLFAKIEEIEDKYCVDNKILLQYWITTNPIVVRDTENKYVTFPFRVTNMLRVKDINLHLERKGVKNSAELALGYQALKNLNLSKSIVSGVLSRESNTKNDFAITSVKRFTDSSNIFWDIIKDNFTFISEKKKDYLNWRYADPRAGNYTVKIAVENNQVLGFIVTELKRIGDHDEGYISELLTLPKRVDVAEALLGDVCYHFDKQKLNAIHYTVVKGTTCQKVARKIGFIDPPQMYNIYLGGYVSSRIRVEFNHLEKSGTDQVHFSTGDYF